MRPIRQQLTSVLSLIATLSLLVSTARSEGKYLEFHNAKIGHGVALHYFEEGSGIPVVFVHGSISDAEYWSPQVHWFASQGFHAIAYSRRYNSPNTNPARPGYSAIVDADDLAALIKKLHLGRVHVVGHSYGALTALFLAVRHPEVVRTLVLAEAPAVSLLNHLQGDKAEIGKSTFNDIQDRMVRPMKEAFQKGDTDSGLRIFLAYVLQNPRAWDQMPEPARQQTLKNTREWENMMTTGELFPTLDPEAVRRITAPALLLSGQNSYPFLGLIDEELDQLLPHRQQIVLHGATHRMWYEQPDNCRTAVLDFWKEQQAHSWNSLPGALPERKPLLELR